MNSLNSKQVLKQTNNAQEIKQLLDTRNSPGWGTRQLRIKVTGPLWVCPECNSKVEEAIRMIKKDEEKGVYGGTYFCCPIHKRDYSLSPEGLQDYINGVGRLSACGSGKIFNTLLASLGIVRPRAKRISDKNFESLVGI